MKKILAAILCVGMMVVCAAGCFNNTNSSTSMSTSDEAKNINPNDYKDSYDGLISYFSDLGYIDTENKGNLEMDADLVGAENGKRFVSKISNTVTIELYEFGSKKDSDEAKKAISSIKESGTFSVLELPAVQANLSANGKYMMIYNDATINKASPDEKADNYIKRAEVIEKFTDFHK